MLHYPLRLLPPTALTALLESVCQREGLTVEPGVLPLVVRAGGGSARQALTVLEQLCAGAGPEGVTHRNAVALVGNTDPILLDEMIDALAMGDAGSMFGAIGRALRVNDDAWMLATNVLRRLRDLVILASVPDAVTLALIDVSPGQLEKMTGQAALLGAAQAIRLADAVAAALDGMQGHIAHRLVLELCCARALLASPPEPSRECAQSDPPAPEAPQEWPDGQDEPPQPALGTAPPPPNHVGVQPTPQSRLILTGIGVDDLRLLWPKVLAAVRLRRRTVEILLRGADLVSIDDGVLHVAVPSAAAARLLMDPANADVLTGALGLVVGLDLPIVAEFTGPVTGTTLP
jgi:DNA polymerase-3 subunit gamma/tau